MELVGVNERTGCDAEGNIIGEGVELDTHGAGGVQRTGDSPVQCISHHRDQYENRCEVAVTFGLAGGLNAGDQQFTLMGIGVWLAIIMFLNVWGVIWPNQKRALGIVAVDDDKKAKAARIAMLGSRTNLLLSLPMLTSMAMYQTLFG